MDNCISNCYQIEDHAIMEAWSCLGPGIQCQDCRPTYKNWGILSLQIDWGYRRARAEGGALVKVVDSELHLI